jgi:hypothetical protein
MWQKLAAAMMEKAVFSAGKLVLVTLAMMFLSEYPQHGGSFYIGALLRALFAACFCGLV